MKLPHLLSIALALTVLVAVPAVAQAAPCPIGTGSCPANTVCLGWTASTTRTSGVALPASELAGYVLSLDGKPYPITTALSMSIPVGVDQTLSTGSIWSIVAVDTGGLPSAANTCTNPVAVAGPKSPPAAVTGFTAAHK